MDIPWKNLMSNTEHLRRNAQFCIRTSSPALRQWHGESLPCLLGDPALIAWPPHTYCVWPCWAHQKYSCTERSMIGLCHLPPQMKNQHGLNEEKPYRKKNLSIELSKVKVWLAWILTTKCKSLKRVETCQRSISISDCFAMLTCYFRINLQMVFTLQIYISFWFVMHWTLDCSFIFEWRCSDLGSERIQRLCFVDCTCTPYSSCLLKVYNHTYWPALSSIDEDHQ